MTDHSGRDGVESALRAGDVSIEEIGAAFVAALRKQIGRP
jgi:hypothetical protein